MSHWPFPDPKNTAVFSTESVMSGDRTILYASHDSDDGAWQFHSGEKVGNSVPKIVALHQIVQLDNSVNALADLPMGWIATRKTPESPWQRSLAD